MFPVIERMSDLTPHIEGAEHIKGYVRDGYIVYDYAYTIPASVWTPHMRECRGIKFHPDGRIAARPLHKFFNLGEHPPESAWLDEPHTMLEKLDGSMIHPIWINGAPRFCTRAGITHVAERAERLFLGFPTMETFLRECEEADWTPIFEYTGPCNRIVIAYEEPRLTLLAIRHKITGVYVPLANEITVGLNVVGTMTATIDQVKALTDREGVVCAWPDGRLIKIKADDYVLRHKTQDNLTHEKNTLLLVLSPTFDDAVPLLAPGPRAAIVFYAGKVNGWLQQLEDEIVPVVARWREHSQKDFALHVKKLWPDAPHKQTLAFAIRKQGEELAWEMLKAYLRKQCTGGTRLNEFAKATGLPRWSYRPPVE